MISADTDFVSEFGWAVTLPPGWSRREGTGTDYLAAETYPVAFTSETIAPAALTWMVLGGEVPAELAAEFELFTLSAHTVDAAAAGRLAKEFFPLLGTVSRAEVIRLPDGTRALELTESFIDHVTTEERSAYHLLSPLFIGGPGSLPHFQRLCFYAESNHFYKNIETVQSISRSFHYRHPFKPHSGEWVFEKGR
jgi:hypothetical protein